MQVLYSIVSSLKKGIFLLLKYQNAHHHGNKHQQQWDLKKKSSEQRGVITDLNNFALHEAFPSAEVTGLKCHVDLNIDSTMFWNKTTDE